MPAAFAAIDRCCRRQIFIAVIDVAAAKQSEIHFLAKPRQCAQIPSARGKGAARILPGGAPDQQAVRLQLDFPSQHRIVKAQAIVDFRQGNGLQRLAIAGAQGLNAPAVESEIAVRIDPLDIDVIAQPVVAADIVPTQEGAVGRQAD